MKTESDWPSLAPHLEDAVAALPRTDRQIVLLRFYQQLSFAQVAFALGISEDAARKRLGRALDKLRARFAAVGAAVSAESLGAVVLQNCTHSAPANLAGSTASANASDLFRAWLRHLRRRLLAQCAVAVGLLLVIGAAATLLLLDQQPPPARAGNIGPAGVPPPTSNATAVDTTTRPSDMTFAQVIAAIQQTEHIFTNVHVKDFQATNEHQAPGEVAWTPTPIRYAGSAWFDADPDGKERLYLTDEVLPWKNGAAPYAEQIVDRSWDGNQSVELRLAGGYSGHMTRTAEAIIDRERSFDLSAYTRQFAGLGFTAQYYLMIEELTNPRKPRPKLSEMIQTYAKRLGKSPDVWGETKNGLTAVRLHFRREVPGKLRVDFGYWFAPTRGFAFLGEDSTVKDANFSRTQSTDVQELKQVAPNIWFPTRVTWTKKDGANSGYTRWTYRADNITVNDPNFDEKIFRITIPTAWVVTDTTGPTRKDYFTMPDGSHLDLQRGTSIPQIRPAASKRPDGDDPPITQEGWAAW